MFGLFSFVAFASISDSVASGGSAELAFELGRGLSATAFLFYGLLCLFSVRMVEEFERYGLAGMRLLTGGLEVAGALGLLLGFLLPPIGTVAAAGLTLLMALGVATRVRIRDSLLQTLPAFVLMLINAYLVVYPVWIAG